MEKALSNRHYCENNIEDFSGPIHDEVHVRVTRDYEPKAALY